MANKVLYSSSHSGFLLSTQAQEKLYQECPEAFHLDDLCDGCEPPEGYAIKVTVDGTPMWASLSEHNFEIRSDPHLIRVIEEIGVEKAGANSCKLAITTLPSGYDYTINEYDGKETVRPRLPYEKIIEDLKQYYLTGCKDFKCPITEKVVSGELKLTPHNHVGGMSY